MRLQHKISGSLKQALEKLKLSENTTEKKGESRNVSSPLFFFFFCPHHRLLLSTVVRVDMKVMLTVEVNG